jgi:gamma-glutamyltranspeptidase/glutathione hydrolase/leukotriene-C4 hydrolase
MDDFSTPGMENSYGLQPSEANFIRPGKRPMSSMSPIIITDNKGDVKLILGASGGSKILSAVSQVAIKILWQNMNLKDAIDDRRVHHQLNPDYIQFEDGFDMVNKTKIKQSFISCFIK